MFDLLIKNAEIYDGTGTEPFIGDVAVLDGKIAAIGHDLGRAKQTVDAQGLALSPGFIDCHSHADGSIFHHAQRDHVLQMGVTTEVCGMCGIALSPLVEDADQKVITTFCGTSGHNPRFFPSFTEQIKAMNSLPMGPNQTVFSGHTPLRYSAMGAENRAPTADELKHMQNALAKAVQEGAQGYTTGLSYVPGIYSDSRELIDIAKAMAPYGGIYSTHSRSESAGLFESVQECIDIAREAKVAVNISHFKVVGKTFWPRCNEALKMIDDANAQGLTVTMDAYPYCAVSTSTTSAIPARFQNCSKPEFAKKLENPAVVEEIRREIFEIDDPSWDNSALHVGLENFLIVGADDTPEVVGKTYMQVGQERGIPAFDAMIDLLKKNHGQIRDVRFAMCEENVEAILAHPLCTVGSDGTFVKGRDSRTHPRAIGSFPRYLGHYIRERKILSRAEGIHRITGMAAQRYRLTNKGFIKVGYDADMVLFDYDRIIDHSDFETPFEPNEGIHQVYMNGQLVIQDNVPTGKYLGKCLPYNRSL